MTEKLDEIINILKQMLARYEQLDDLEERVDELKEQLEKLEIK